MVLLASVAICDHEGGKRFQLARFRGGCDGGAPMSDCRSRSGESRQQPSLVLERELKFDWTAGKRVSAPSDGAAGFGVATDAPTPLGGLRIVHVMVSLRARGARR